MLVRWHPPRLFLVLLPQNLVTRLRRYAGMSARPALRPALTPPCMCRCHMDGYNDDVRPAECLDTCCGTRCHSFVPHCMMPFCFSIHVRIQGLPSELLLLMYQNASHMQRARRRLQRMPQPSFTPQRVTIHGCTTHLLTSTRVVLHTRPVLRLGLIASSITMY